MKSASEVLQSLLQNSKSPLSQQFVRWRLWRHWEEVVGPDWAQVSKPVEFDKGRLIIWVASSAHFQELTYLLEPLKLKINQYLRSQFVYSIRLTQRLGEYRDPETTTAVAHGLDRLGQNNKP